MRDREIMEEEIIKLEDDSHRDVEKSGPLPTAANDISAGKKGYTSMGFCTFELPQYRLIFVT